MTKFLKQGQRLDVRLAHEGELERVYLIIGCATFQMVVRPEALEQLARAIADHLDTRPQAPLPPPVPSVEGDL
jgi:hypothetical protein